MTGNHSKGKAMERDWIRLHPDLECFDIPMGKFNDNDAFGIADIIALGLTGVVHFVQVCHRSTVARHRNAIQAFVDAHTPPREYVIALYSWKARKPQGKPAIVDWRFEGVW